MTNSSGWGELLKTTDAEFWKKLNVVCFNSKTLPHEQQLCNRWVEYRNLWGDFLTKHKNPLFTKHIRNTLEKEEYYSVIRVLIELGAMKV